VTFKAIIDDSQDENGTFVLAGYVARAEAWTKFTQEWQKLLPRTRKGRSGKHRFKMNEMVQSEELRAHLPAFFRVIEAHVLGSIATIISTSDLRRVQARIFVPGAEIDWGVYANPYYVTYRCLMDKFHSARLRMANWIPPNEQVNFVFDMHSSQKEIRTSWDHYIAGRADDLRGFYGACPIFEDDEEFLPLQAADFWSWWVRKWDVQGTPEKIRKWDFDGFGASEDKKFLRIEIRFNQDELARVMIDALRAHIGPDKPIIDLRGLDSFSPGSAR
jgi:hypothetical protein